MTLKLIGLSEVVEAVEYLNERTNTWVTFTKNSPPIQVHHDCQRTFAPRGNNNRKDDIVVMGGSNSSPLKRKREVSTSDGGASSSDVECMGINPFVLGKIPPSRVDDIVSNSPSNVLAIVNSHSPQALKIASTVESASIVPKSVIRSVQSTSRTCPNHVAPTPISFPPTLTRDAKSHFGWIDCRGPNKTIEAAFSEIFIETFSKKESSYRRQNKTWRLFQTSGICDTDAEPVLWAEVKKLFNAQEDGGGKKSPTKTKNISVKSESKEDEGGGEQSIYADAVIDLT